MKQYIAQYTYYLIIFEDAFSFGYRLSQALHKNRLWLTADIHMYDKSDDYITSATVDTIRPQRNKERANHIKDFEKDLLMAVF